MLAKRNGAHRRRDGRNGATRHVIAAAAGSLLWLSLGGGSVLAATLAPAPEIESVGRTDSSLAAVWSATPSRRGKTTYTVRYCASVDGMMCDPLLVGKTTKSLTATIADLAPATDHYLQVLARDAGGNTATGEVFGPYTTCASGESCDGGGGGDPGACNYPAFSNPPGAVTSYPFVKPAWATLPGNLRFEEDFGDGNAESWIIEDMRDLLNRSGNSGIDRDGNFCGNCSPEGKRWSAWYDGNRSSTIGGHANAQESVDASGVYRIEGIGENGVLALGGLVERDTPDPTRPGAGSPWSNNRLYTSWIKTWARDPAAPATASGQNIPGRDKWTAPMYLEAGVDFASMNTPGFRLSMWLMPATYDAEGTMLATGTEAYDGNFKNGFELDLFEYEPWKPECKDLLEFSWINSFATKGKQGRNASGKTHLKRADVGTGSHTFGFLWETDRMLWVYDGEVVLEVTDPSRIPEIYQYLNISREMTNGLLSGDSQFGSGDDYFLPPESGLYGFEGGSDVGTYIDNIDADKARIDYVRIYSLDP